MKKNKLLSGILTGCIVFGVCSCSQLQATLSSSQNKKLSEETGIASFSGKNWFYNGVAGQDMKAQGTVLGENFMNHSLKINFSKKAALSELAGSLKITYVDDKNFSNTKTITDLQGSFSDDSKAFYLDMSSVLPLLGGSENPSGIATVEVTVSGFVCAEGNQKGRPIGALSEKITAKPLYTTKSIDFSTCWYVPGKTQIQIPLNSSVSLVGNSAAYSVKKGDYSFKISAGDKEILITPESDLKGVVTSLEFPIYGILAENDGHAFNETFVVNLVNRAIVIDGKKDLNYEKTENGAITVKDAAADQNAFGHSEIDWVGGMPDLTAINIVNDAENIYIGVEGTLAFNWNDKLVLMICKNNDTVNDASASNYLPAENTSYWKGRPNIYVYHMPGYENSGKGSFNVNYSAGKDNISGNCDAAPYGWTDETNGNFLEYSIPLVTAGFKSGDKIKIIAAASLKWDEGLAVCDVLPDAAVRKEENGRTTIQFDFEKAIEYTIQ